MPQSRYKLKMRKGELQNCNIISLINSDILDNLISRFMPIHWAVAKPNPNIDVVFLLAEEYQQGLLEADNEGNTPLMRYPKVAYIFILLLFTF